MQSYLHAKDKPAEYTKLASNKDKLKLCLKIASGVQFLHEKGIAHLQLSNMNILIDKNLVPKVSDFGFTKVKELASIFIKYRNKNSYTSPELLQINSQITNCFKAFVEKNATYKYKTYLKNQNLSSSPKNRKLSDLDEKDEDYESCSSIADFPIKLLSPVSTTKNFISKQDYLSAIDVDQSIVYKSDIYSLGILFWEIFSELPPFTTSLKEVYRIVVDDHLRPEIIPNKLPKNMALVIKKCWSQDYKLRPTINQLVLELSSLSL